MTQVWVWSHTLTPSLPSSKIFLQLLSLEDSETQVVLFLSETEDWSTWRPVEVVEEEIDCYQWGWWSVCPWRCDSRSPASPFTSSIRMLNLISPVCSQWVIVLVRSSSSSEHMAVRFSGQIPIQLCRTICLSVYLVARDDHDQSPVSDILNSNRAESSYFSVVHNLRLSRER